MGVKRQPSQMITILKCDHFDQDNGPNSADAISFPCGPNSAALQNMENKKWRARNEKPSFYIDCQYSLKRARSAAWGRAHARWHRSHVCALRLRFKTVPAVFRSGREKGRQRNAEGHFEIPKVQRR